MKIAQLRSGRAW